MHLGDAAFLSGGGEMGALLRSHDWRNSPLGAPATWPQALRTALRLMLNTRHPVFIFWGADALCFYNDAYRQSIGPERHPGALGRRGREVWEEIWHEIGPQISQVMSGGPPTWHENQLLPITRNGRLEDVYWTYSYGPIDDETAATGTGGVLVLCTETTSQVLAGRRENLRGQRLARLFEQAPSFMALLEGPDHRISLVNPGYLKLVGHRAVLGRTVAEALPDAVEQGFLALLDEVRASGRAFSASSMRYGVQAMQGGPVDERFVDFVYQPIVEDDGRVSGVFVEGVDVTERVTSDQALRDSEAHWRGLFEKLQEGFFIAEMVRDAGGRVIDWRFVEMNKAWEQGSGLTRADARGRTVRAVIPGIEEVWIRNLGAVADTGRAASFSQTVGELRRNYEVRAFALSAERIAVLFYETSERDRATGRRTALLELSERLRDLQDPEEIAYVTAEILGRTLGVSRAGYGEVDTLNETIRIARDWSAPGIGSIAGVLNFREYGSYIEDLKRGDTAIVADAYRDPRTTTSADALRRISAVSFVNMPLSEQGEFVALLFLNHAEAREWPQEEVDFVREAAERTRQAVERRRAEHNLRQLAASLEQAVVERTRERDRVWRNAQDLIIITDAAGLVRQVNPAVSRVLGWAPEQLLGRQMSEFILADDSHRRAPDLDSLPSGQLPAYVNRCRHQDGSARWISWVATVEERAMFAYGRDISAEKEQAHALEQTRASLRAIFETSYQLQVLLRTDGTLLDANATSLAAIESTLGAVVGKPFWETPWFVSTPGMPERVRSAVLTAAQGTHERMELSLQVPAGLRHYDFSMRPIRDVNGDVVAIVPEAVDITQRQRAEGQLRQAQKMEAVGQLTGGLAHDFNNLLTGIGGSLEMLQSRVAQGKLSAIDRYVTAAQGAAKRAAALTHRLLAFSRRQTLDPKSTDVNRLVADMAELIRRTVGPAVQFDVVGAGGLWPTLVDPNQLENALLNLCINARDAMPHGGRVTIETANKWLDERAAKERDLPPGQYVSLCVSDTGTGMTPEVIARAFDPFFTTKPLGAGTGLGLSMIYGFARQSGGQVRIYSELGQGTTMCLYLPRDHAAPEVETPLPSGSRSDRQGEGEVVLVVDDEPTIRMLIAEVLEDFGYACIEAADGPTGIKVLESAAKIDLLITDVGLPGGINGRQLADAARVLRPELKILFITGYAENAVVGNGHLEPGMQLLTKPFAMDTLAERIKSLVQS